MDINIGTKKQKYADYKLLKLLNERAEKKGLNRILIFEKLPIKKSEFYPITPLIFHEGWNGQENAWRCRVTLNGTPDIAILDIAEGDFDFVPTMDIDKTSRSKWQLGNRSGRRRKNAKS